MHKTIRCFLLVLTLFLWLTTHAQPGLYRLYPTPTQGFGIPNPQSPLSTADGGYLLSNWNMVIGFESPGGLGFSYTIKTDSAFVPQWRKNYPRAISLPSGGIILFGGNTIEKVTASGVQVWIKTLSTPVILNDAVVYGNKIRFVGNQVSYTFAPFTTLALYTSDAFTLLTDTSGVQISNGFFHSSVVNSVYYLNATYRGSAEFSKIKRDTQGNFYVYSNLSAMTGIGTNMAIAKFDSSFNFVWGKTWNNSLHRVQITDIDILSNGRIFASGITCGNNNPYWYNRAALLKFNSQGNLVAQHYFEHRTNSSSLTKKANGNYVFSLNNNDSLFMAEVDTSMNIQWHKFVGKGSAIAGAAIKNNKLYNPIFSGSSLVLISNSINGQSCASYSMAYTKPTSTVSLINFSLSPVAYTTALISGTVNNSYSQNYIDSCVCPVFIPGFQSQYCVGTTASVSVVGTGALSWYYTAVGNSFIQGGPTFTYSGSTATSITVYAQDSACTANPHRTAVSFTIHALPNLFFNPSTPTVCAGSNVFVSVGGALTFTWSHGLSSGSVQNLNPLTTTIYTVTGSIAPGCSDTKTVALNVFPLPNIVTSSPGTLCVGQAGTVSATGANTYTWNNGQTGPTATVTPAFPINYNYFVSGSNGTCTSGANTFVQGMPVPQLSVVASSTSVCAGETLTLTASGAYLYSWSAGSTGPILLTTPTVNSTYVVTGNNYGCSKTDSIAINVQALPQVLASASSATVCVGDTVVLSASGANTYIWSNSLTGNTISIHASLGNNSYVVAGSNGICNTTVGLNVVGVNVPLINVAGPSTVCIGDTVILTASGANSYTWNNGIQGSTFAFNPMNPNVYNLTLVGAIGDCVGASQHGLNAIAQPTVQLALSSPTLCAGTSVTVSASGASSYTWGNGSTTSVIQLSPLSNLTMSVFGSNGICGNTQSFSLGVFSGPTLNVVPNNTIVCDGEPVIFTAYGANSYTWHTGANTNIVNFIPLANTVYTLQGADQMGCVSTGYFTQIVSPCLGINDSSSVKAPIQIYPNPNIGLVIIKRGSDMNDQNIQVMSVEGKVLHTIQLREEETELDLESLANGLYLIRIIETGQIIKMVKER